MSLEKSPTAPILRTSSSIVFEDFDVDFDPNTGWIVLIYGKSGCGKTWFCGTADHSLYLNTGGGIDTLVSPLFKAKYPHIVRKKLDIYDTKRKYGFDLLTDAMDQFLADDELRSFVKTVILDDASSLRSLAVNHGNKAQLGEFQESDGMNNARMEMNRINWFLETYIPILRGLGINFLMTAHEARIYGKAAKLSEERPLREIRPGFGGEKFVDYVPSKFDEVWWMEKKEGKGNTEFTQFKTGGGGIELTKTRKNGVFAFTEMGKDFEQLLQQRKNNKLHPSFNRS